MKYELGKKIAIVYTLFAVGMVGMVIWSTKFDVNLVTENYYEKEVDHDAKMQAVANSSKLEIPLDIKYTPAEGKITLRFPEAFSRVEGKVLLYCISDRKQDKEFDIEVSESLQELNVEGYKPGRWTVKVDWHGDGMRYYDEKNVLLLRN
ncbi:MAG: FixH family protein [Bacteroidia bacterium]